MDKKIVRVDLKDDIIETPDGRRWYVTKCRVDERYIDRDWDGFQHSVPRAEMDLTLVRVPQQKEQHETKNRE